MTQRHARSHREWMSSRALPLAVIVGITIAAVAGVARFVDLQPYVEPNFFFSSDDPALQEDRRISELFPHPPQIILSVKGATETRAYRREVKRLTKAIAVLPEVVGVQSMTKGPGDYDDALKSPLWRRLLIAEEGRATNIIILIKDVPPERIVNKIEALQREYQQPHFDIVISGVPYVLELIRRNLGRDFRVFSLAAFLVLGLVVLALFRLVRLMVGVLICCANASLLTLIATQFLGIRMEVLTANLAAIVFVLCLSHLVFLTFNWEDVGRRRLGRPTDRIPAAIRLTLGPSFWSMLTTMLGFMSLLFVQAAPMRNLGRAGAVGTLVAFLVAYGMYPWFLRLVDDVPPRIRSAKRSGQIWRGGSRKRQLMVAGLVIGAALLVAPWASRLQTDPSLLSYFTKNGTIHRGLAYIDRNLGSSPLTLVVSDPKGKDFDSRRTYRWLWRLQEALEQDEAVGSVISLPLLLAEARRLPLVAYLPVGWVIKAMEHPRFDEVARYFLSEDRYQVLFWLMMREQGRRGPRLEIVKRIQGIARAQGFTVDLTGGVYLLQGQMAELITASLRSGLTMLITLCVLMVWLLSGSRRVAVAMLVSLSLIPMWLLGLIGRVQAPFDIIAAPAVNLTIGMGIDAMLHLLSAVRRQGRGAMTSARAWTVARGRLWQPVLYSAGIVCVGFSIFGLSTFPPTQRFGLSIVVGTVMSPLAALLVFPALAVSPRARPSRSS